LKDFHAKYPKSIIIWIAFDQYPELGIFGKVSTYIIKRRATIASLVQDCKILWGIFPEKILEDKFSLCPGIIAVLAIQVKQNRRLKMLRQFLACPSPERGKNLIKNGRGVPFFQSTGRDEKQAQNKNEKE
jgi:hypothetical protein